MKNLIIFNLVLVSLFIPYIIKAYKKRKKLKSNIKDNFEDFFFFESVQKEKMKAYLFNKARTTKSYNYYTNKEDQVVGIWIYSGGGVEKIAQRGDILPKAMTDRYTQMVKDTINKYKESNNSL